VHAPYFPDPQEVVWSADRNFKVLSSPSEPVSGQVSDEAISEADPFEQTEVSLLQVDQFPSPIPHELITNIALAQCFSDPVRLRKLPLYFVTRVVAHLARRGPLHISTLNDLEDDLGPTPPGMKHPPRGNIARFLHGNEWIFICPKIKLAKGQHKSVSFQLEFIRQVYQTAWETMTTPAGVWPCNNGNKQCVYRTVCVK
jgi:hypothetical protein